MSKIRVHELSKELGKNNKEVLDLLTKHNVEVTSHMSALSDGDAEMVRKYFSKPAHDKVTQATPVQVKPVQPKAEPAKSDNTGDIKKSHISQVFNPQNSSRSDGRDNRRPDGNRPYNNNRQDGGNRPYNNNRTEDGGSRPYNNNRPDGGSRPYNNNRPDGGSRPYNNNRPDGGSRPYNNNRPDGGSRPYNNNRPDDGGSRPYNNNRTEDGGSRPYNNNRPDGASRPYNNNRPDGGSRPYNNNRPDGGSRPYNNNRPDGGSRPYNNNRPDGTRPDGGSRPYNNNRPDGASRPYNNNRPDGTRPDGGNRPYNNNRPDGGSRPYNNTRPDGGSRPYNNNRPDGGSRPYNNNRPDGGGSRPYNNNRPDGGGSRPYNNNRPTGDRNGNGRPDNRGGFRNDDRRNGTAAPETGDAIKEARDAREAKEQRSRDRETKMNERSKYEKSERLENTKALEKEKHKLRTAADEVKKEEELIKTLILPDTLTIKELADKMKIQPSVVVKKLFLKGTVVTINQEVEYDTAEEIALDFNCVCEHEVKIDVIEELLKEEDDKEEDLVQRPPVVCVMGHVDHGKTSLLDAIRQTNVIAREAGGITQHIGAYTVDVKGQQITFLDTPGHEAFTAMRMRGAKSTDIAVLVVAADDGVMPQTIEAINHAKAAGIDIVVAVNKIDKPSANIERVKQELVEYELVAEDWGGDTIFVPVSAHTKEGIDTLLEMILLTSEMRELKSNPNRKARGLVIEAKLDKGKGPVATLLVQKGTLHVGDFIAVGPCHGKIRAMIDDKGTRIDEAGPSIPVEVLGINDVPNAGDVFVSPDTEKEARAFAETYISEGRVKLLDDTKAKLSLDDLFTQIKAGNVKELGIIVKADVQGSVEAVKQSLVKISNEEVVVKVIHAGVGSINESDVILASASNAIIIGFNVRPDNMAREIASRENVDMRMYKVIYQAIEDVEAAMKGMLDPKFEEKIIGHVEVRQTYKASGIGTIAGAYVLDGYITRNANIRLTRGKDLIYDGPLASLKRFKDDVKEVKEGYECGIVFEKFNDIKEGDQIEASIMVEIKQ